MIRLMSTPSKSLIASGSYLVGFRVKVKLVKRTDDGARLLHHMGGCFLSGSVPR